MNARIRGLAPLRHRSGLGEMYVGLFFGLPRCVRPFGIGQRNCCGGAWLRGLFPGRGAPVTCLVAAQLMTIPCRAMLRVTGNGPFSETSFAITASGRIGTPARTCRYAVSDKTVRMFAGRLTPLSNTATS